MSHVKIVSYIEVNNFFENGTINVVKLPNREGFERRIVTVDKKPLRISSPQFNYKSFSIEEKRKEAIEIQKMISTGVGDTEFKEYYKKMEKNGYFENLKKNRFEVHFEGTNCPFVDEMEKLSQSIKDSFDRHFNCQTENNIVETTSDESSLYPQTYKSHSRKFKFSSLFHAVNEDSNYTVAHIIRDGKRVKIDADLENFHKETKGELVKVRFIFAPVIYSKDDKYYLKNEVIYIEFSNIKRVVTNCAFIDDDDEEEDLETQD